MKRLVIAVLFSLLFMAYPAQSADSVEPSSVTFTNVRDEAVGAIKGVYYEDSTLIFTNCICTSDTAGIVTQGLDEVTVTINVGNTTTNVPYDGIVGGTSNNWSVSITVPTNIPGTISVQTKITDANTNIYIYPWKNLSHKESM